MENEIEHSDGQTRWTSHKPIDISVVIVSWNVSDKLRENLLALNASVLNDFTMETIVVDNDSADCSAEMVRDEFPETLLIDNPDNRGFATACNQGIARAQGRYILLLNPDNKVFSDTLRQMIEWMDAHQQAKVAGCHLVDGVGETVMHVRRFPRLLDQLAIILKIPHLWPGVLDAYLRRDFDYTIEAQVDSVRGGFFMVRSEGEVDIPFYLDERYFIWFEEVDFCRKVVAAGGQVWYTPVARCVDHVGQSFNQVGLLKKQNYFRDSMIKYFRKWHPWWQAKLIEWAWYVGYGVSWLGVKLSVSARAKT